LKELKRLRLKSLFLGILLDCLPTLVHRAARPFIVLVILLSFICTVCLFTEFFCFVFTVLNFWKYLSAPRTSSCLQILPSSTVDTVNSCSRIAGGKR
jgi:hypothetical protein